MFEESRFFRGLPSAAPHDVPDPLHAAGLRRAETALKAIAWSDLTARLEAAGADVTAVQINDREWNVKVSVPPGTKRQAIREQLSNAGFGVIGGEGEIDLAVTKP